MDFENIPFAVFFEKVIPWLVSWKASKIAISASNEDGQNGCAYFQCEATDKETLADAIRWDAYMERLENNKDFLKELLNEDKE